MSHFLSRSISRRNNDAMKCNIFRLFFDVSLSLLFCRDGDLRKREFRAFRLKMTREMATGNRFCARNFWHYCDFNDDKRVSKREWNTCLGADINSECVHFSNLLKEFAAFYQNGMGDGNAAAIRDVANTVRLIGIM